MPKKKTPIKKDLVTNITKKLSPKIGADYTIINVDNTFSGKASPGKTFIYLFMKNDDKQKNLLTPFYVGKTSDTVKRFSNHSIKNKFIAETDSKNLNIYIAGSLITDFAFLAEKDLIKRLTNNNFEIINSTNETFNEVSSSQDITTLIEEWLAFWKTKELEKINKLPPVTSINRTDLKVYLDHKKFASSLSTMIAKALVETYNSKTSTATVILKTSDVTKDIEYIQKAIKDLRYWKLEQKLAFGTQLVFSLTNKARDYVLDIKNSRNIVNNVDKVEENVKPKVINVKYYIKKQTTGKTSETIDEVNIKIRNVNNKKRMLNFFKTNPAISNSEFVLVNKILSQLNHEKYEASLSKNSKDLAVFESGSLKQYFSATSNNLETATVFSLTDLAKNKFFPNH